MNLQHENYKKYALVKDMLETGDIVKRLDIEHITSLAERVNKPKVLLTGEGSSRIFPAKKILYDAFRLGYTGHIFTEAGKQALEYDLKDVCVFVASNSGKTKEGVRLIRHLRKQGHNSIIGVIANSGTPIQLEANAHYLLSCGQENAVAATKSVVEQALFYDLVFRTLNGQPLPDLNKLGDLITQVLEMTIPEEVIQALTTIDMLYWAGRNNGVAEELTLKTNEITRKKSDYLEGTYAVHGIEEVMDADEAVIVISPFKDEEDKFSEVLEKGVGLKILAISSSATRFPTVLIPEFGDFTPYLELMAGWNLLVEIGVRTSIDLDKPVRARKVGNIFIDDR